MLRALACCAIAGGITLPAAGRASAQMLGEPSQGGPTTPPPAYVQAPPPGYPPAPPAAAGPLNFDAVMSGAYSQSAFTFDRSMLKAADGFFAGGDPETRRVVAGLNSITVRNYRARDVARYDPGALAFLDGQLRSAGWRHLVNANAHAGNTTDLWLHFSGGDINNVTVLTRGDRVMNVIAVDCDLRPLDLLHLSGHFGIPKVDENAVMVPAH